MTTFIHPSCAGDEPGCQRVNRVHERPTTIHNHLGSWSTWRELHPHSLKEIMRTPQTKSATAGSESANHWSTVSAIVRQLPAHWSMRGGGAVPPPIHWNRLPFIRKNRLTTHTTADREITIKQTLKRLLLFSPSKYIGVKVKPETKIKINKTLGRGGREC